ncbi:MAG: tetratricopeptide repeat protein [Armatimonadota bacterium]|nr:tetratricopeptide repeat protein [Armatimonadota bacterium]
MNIDRSKTLSEAAHLRRAAVMEERGMYEEAANSLIKALTARPDNADSWSRLGGLYRSLSKFDMAVEVYKKSLEINPNNSITQESLLQTYLEMGRYDEAIAHCKDLLKRMPRNLYARDVLSVAYMQLGLIDKALRITDELIRLDPTDPGNHFKKGVLFQQKGEVGMAIREFARVIEMAPDSSIAEQAKQAVSSLDSYQLRQIVSLASEDSVFRTKLSRDAESAALEKGFVLSYTGLVALRQISFDNPPEPGDDSGQKYYHYH